MDQDTIEIVSPSFMDFVLDEIVCIHTKWASWFVAAVRILPPQPNKQDPLLCGSCFYKTSHIIGVFAALSLSNVVSV